MTMGFFDMFSGFAVELVNITLHYSTWGSISSLCRTCKAGERALCEIHKRHTRFGIGYLHPIEMYYVQRANDHTLTYIPTYVNKCIVAIQLALQRCVGGVSIVLVDDNDELVCRSILWKYFPHTFADPIKNRQIILVDDLNKRNEIMWRQRDLVVITSDYYASVSYDRIVERSYNRVINTVVVLDEDDPNCKAGYLVRDVPHCWINSHSIPFTTPVVDRSAQSMSLHVAYDDCPWLETIRSMWNSMRASRLVVISYVVPDVQIKRLFNQVHTFSCSPNLTYADVKIMCVDADDDVDTGVVIRTYEERQLNRFSHTGGILLVTYSKGGSLKFINDDLNLRVIADRVLVCVETQTTLLDLQETHTFARTLCAYAHHVDMTYHVSNRIRGPTLTRCCLLDCSLTKDVLDNSQVILEKGIDVIMQMSPQDRIALLCATAVRPSPARTSPTKTTTAKRVVKNAPQSTGEVTKRAVSKRTSHDK